MTKLTVKKLIFLIIILSGFACSSGLPDSLSKTRFAYEFNGCVYVMNGDGSSKQKILSTTEGNPQKFESWATLKNRYYQPHLAADKKTLVCVRSNNNSGGFGDNSEKLNKLQSFDLLLMDVESNTKPKILKSSQVQQPLASPRFSPDQKSLAYLFNGDLMVLDIATGSESKIVLPNEIKRYPYPNTIPTNYMIGSYLRWSKNGQWICVFNNNALTTVIDTQQNLKSVSLEELPGKFWEENIIVKKAIKDQVGRHSVKFVYPEISDDYKFVLIRKKEEGFMAKYWYEAYDIENDKYIYVKTIKRFLYIE